MQSNNLMSIDEHSPAPPKPRVELDENNLLSGFMKEFGLNMFSN